MTTQHYTFGRINIGIVFQPIVQLNPFNGEPFVIKK